MSEKIEDGGPAFPVPFPNGGQFGMSLRDWFAGQCAAQVFATASGARIDANIVAHGAYLLADALLAEGGHIEPGKK